MNKQNIKAITKFIEDEYTTRKTNISSLKRCSKCVLPETMPFIEFDEDGVCNYCKNYKPIKLKGESELEEILKNHRKTDGSPDCVMTFSRGRDSSYALHYLKKELGMNPVAYSYDWGMMTDLALRNQTLMTKKLGVEHKIVTANIKKKRENIKLNVEAWLKRPSLGTVPLFMAGDKQYFYYANKVRKDIGISLGVIGGCLLEVAEFKTGYSGISPRLNKEITIAENLSFISKMLFYYGKEFLLNPAFINKSIFDTLGGFISYYITPHNLLQLFEYISWEENEIEKVLINEYGWEMATDTKSSWRIGDGTAGFYNYIYYMIGGITENDTFRSNQIREGLISREEALKKSEKEDIPRIDSMIWYADVIGFDLLEALKIIHKQKPLYEKNN